METLAIIIIVSHYLIPILFLACSRIVYCFKIAIMSYILTFIALWVLVCIMPWCNALRYWLTISTALCWLFGVFGSSEHTGKTSDRASMLIIPALIGTVIWIWAL